MTVRPDRPARRLLLLRHAQASAPLGVVDHDRELTARGRRQAAAVGRWLAEHAISPDLVICSTATRTRQTWGDAIAANSQAATRVHLDRRVYLGGTTGVLQAITEEALDALTVLVVGHAPTMPLLADWLCDPHGRHLAPAQLAGFPPAGLAVLRLAVPWTELTAGVADLESVVFSEG